MKGLNLNLGDEYNIYVTSDVHGNYPLFKELIDSLPLRDEDYLIVLGDSINRYPYSLECLDLLMELNKRERTILAMGNHEEALYHLITGFNEMSDVEIDKNTRGTSLQTLFSYWANTEYEIETIADARKVLPEVREKIKDQIELIGNMYLYINTEDFFFVHSGINPDKPLEEQSIADLLSNYDFFDKENPFKDKTMVMGHWPTKAIPNGLRVSSDVRYFKDKRMIFIDGGNSLDMDRKSFHDLYGQINCLHIKKENGVITTDEKCVEVKNDYIAKMDVEKYSDLDLCLNFGTYRISIEDYDEDFYFCESVNNGLKGLLLKDFYKVHSFPTTYAGKFLSVKKGERVNVKKEYTNFFMVKYNHEFGLVPKDKFVKA